MAKLRIYDSQGVPIRDESATTNQKVKDFFFDGVRFAVDKNRQELFCFFRARDNSTARSEQYYAVYDYDSRSEMNTLVDAVESRIEGEYGMQLDTSNDDTRFFQLLSDPQSRQSPSDISTVDDVRELLSNYQRAKLGVGSYAKAYGLFAELYDSDGVSTLAVSDNASGSSVSSYDLVIENGDYFSLELLGETEAAIEELRERRRSTFGTDEPEDDTLLSPVEGAALFGGVGVLLLLAVAYGGCLAFGVPIPGVGDPPGVSCGAETASLQTVSATADGNDSVLIAGNVSGATNTNATMGVEVARSDGNVTVNDSATSQLDGDGTFVFTLSLQNQSFSPGNYTLELSYEGSTANDSFTVAPPANDTASNTTSTPPGQLERVDAPAVVDPEDGTLTLDGNVSGVSNTTLNLSVAVTDDSGSAVVDNTSTVAVDANGTFTFSVPVSLRYTDTNYTVELSYNNTTVTDTFTVATDEVGQLTSISSNVDGEAGNISLQGETTNISADTRILLDIVVVNDTDGTTLYEGSSIRQVNTEGSIDFFQVSVPQPAIPAGNYTVSVSYNGETRDDGIQSTFGGRA